MRKTLITAYFISLPLIGACVFVGFLSFFWAITLSYVGAVIIFVDSPKWRRKAFLALAVVLFASSILISWPFGYLLPMSGYVKDKNTGKPISNAIFEVEWSYHYATAAGATSEIFDRTFVVSDKDGQYRINGRMMFPLPPASNRIFQSFRLRYPLYKSFSCSGNDCAEYPVLYTDEDHWKQVNNKYYIWRKPHFRLRFGRTRRDFEMVSDMNLSELDAYVDSAVRLGLAGNIEWSPIFKACFAGVSDWPESDTKERAKKILGETQARVSGERYYAK